MDGPFGVGEDTWELERFERNMNRGIPRRSNT